MYVCLRFRVQPCVIDGSATVEERPHRIPKEGASRAGARTHPAATEGATPHVLPWVMVDEEVLVQGSVGGRTRVFIVTVVR